MTKVREEMVTTPEQLLACCAHVNSCAQFGLDTEFVGEDTYHPRLCLVQVAAGNRLFLIDPVTTGPLDALWSLVVDPARVVVVHAGREEVRLCQFWAGQPPGNLFDLQVAAGLVGYPFPLGHGPLVAQVLGIRLTKGETLTEWRQRPLTAAQIRYAFDDVRYLLPLWRKLSGRLQELERCAWAQEEFARLKTTAIPEENAPERWRRLRGLGSLDRRRLALARALFLWREDTATQVNRPPRTVLRDDLIVEIARRNPARERDLHSVRGLARRHLPQIMQAVAEAKALPLEACPECLEREQDPSQVALIVNVLQAVLADVCVRKQLAPNLVTNTNDIKQLIRSRLTNSPLPEDLLLTQGWRAQHLLPELLAILDGQKALRIANLRAPAPLAYLESNPPT
jgi:ribonuclease D